MFSREIFLVGFQTALFGLRFMFKAEVIWKVAFSCALSGVFANDPHMQWRHPYFVLVVQQLLLFSCRTVFLLWMELQTGCQCIILDRILVGWQRHLIHPWQLVSPSYSFLSCTHCRLMRFLTASFTLKFISILNKISTNLKFTSHVWDLKVTKFGVYIL